MVATAAATIHLFTGNNVGPKGDLASRSLQVRLDVDRVDPENRPFTHPDPIGWTGAPGRNPDALYTILLGNPALDLPQDAAGDAVLRCGTASSARPSSMPRCAQAPPSTSASLFLVRKPMTRTSCAAGSQAPTTTPEKIVGDAEFRPGYGDLHHLPSRAGRERPDRARLPLFPTLPTGAPVSGKQLSKRLRAYRNQTVKCAGRTLALRGVEDKTDKTLKFEIAVRE